MAPYQATNWGEGTVRLGVLATLRVQRKKVDFGMEEQCFFGLFYFLMGGWEDLFKMGQATPPFRASISPSVNCRYDY